MEEDFRCVEGGIHTAKEGVILEKCNGCWSAVGCHELVHDFDNFHGRVLLCEIGIGGELECIVDAVIEPVVACLLDVLV